MTAGQDVVSFITEEVFRRERRRKAWLALRIAIFATAVIGVVVVALDWYTSLPTVYYSSSTYECVKVERWVDGEMFTTFCGEDLERMKYRVVWIK